MTFLQKRRIKGKIYLYLDKSIRVGGKVIKITKSLGPAADATDDGIKIAKSQFMADIESRLSEVYKRELRKRYSKFGYPLSQEELEKIEIMNLKYKMIMRSLSKCDIEDIKKRFIANFVFESNAIEGNSLTLKNFSEIVFENNITKGASLREIYDAKNSYEAFSKLYKMRKPLTKELIIWLHKQLMKGIDTRISFRKLNSIILGRRIKTSEPGNIERDVEELIRWYEGNRKIVHPLEIAFKFHHKFEVIHPFADGNGRVGRMLLNYILIANGYFPVIIRKLHRNSYLKVLEAADNRCWIPLMRFALKKAKYTYKKFFETYYLHSQ